jgi:hypothetical protein
MSLKCCRIDNILCFPSGGKQNNAITGICKHLGARTHTHTHTHTWLSASARLPTTPLLYTSPEIQLLTTPTHTSSILSSANTSPHLNPTAHNHGYYAVADYSIAAILSAGLCARSPENDEIGQKCQKLWVHTYPTVSSRLRGRCVQSLIQIGSEMWICIMYKHTHTHTHNNIHLYT